MKPNRKPPAVVEADANALFEALLLLKTKDELRRFFCDLCTPAEVEALTERWRVARLLHEGRLSYRDIRAATGVSLATIGRVARFLTLEPHKGYQTALRRLLKR